jgi:hypothetical protein
MSKPKVQMNLKFQIMNPLSFGICHSLDIWILSFEIFDSLSYQALSSLDS